MDVKNTWLTRTHQNWKVLVFIGLMVADFFLFIFFIWGVNFSTATAAQSFSFIFLGFVAFFWLWVSIRCQNCGCGVARHVIRTKAVGSWFTDLMVLQECPNCHDSYQR
jgi:uncharacterized membrane protein